MGDMSFWTELDGLDFGQNRTIGVKRRTITEPISSRILIIFSPVIGKMSAFGRILERTGLIVLLQIALNFKLTH